jgi:hypothetical protein
MKQSDPLQGDLQNNDMLEAFKQSTETGVIDTKSSGKRKIQANMLLEMLSLDRERALTMVKAWATFVELAASRQHHTHFQSLAEYIPYRILDVGQM